MVINIVIVLSYLYKYIYNFIKRNPNQEILEIPIGGGSKKDKDAVKKYFILKDAVTEEKVEIEKMINDLVERAKIASEEYKKLDLE